MKTIDIILLCILIFLAMIGIVFIISSIFLYIKSKRIAPFVEKVFRNKIHCGQINCDPKIIDRDVPKFDIKYNQDIAKYCIDLIQRLYNNIDTGKLIRPKDLKNELEIDYSKNEGIIGAIWSNNDTIFIIFRGTKYIDEWLTDFNNNQSFYTLQNSEKSKNLGLSDIDLAPSVHSGFYNVYTHIREQILDTIKLINKDKKKNIIVCGHSLGSGIATLCSLDLVNNDYKNLVSYVFACPRVGNQKFANLIKNINLFNIMNRLDVVPNLPLAVSPNFYNINQPYIYVNSGKIITFEDNWDSISNNHSLGIYLKNIPINN
jgi:predicted lipase